MLALDLSWVAASLFAVAEPVSVARMLLEEALPFLLEDARRVLAAGARSVPAPR